MKLHAPAYKPLTPGAIRPSGWLAQQLQVQAEGLSGNLDTFWPDVRDSQWIGGDSESWERVPYWLDGLIPLAYVLDNAALKAKVHHYMDYIITHQHEDGWFGPKTMVAGAGQLAQAHYDLWAQILFSKVLIQYAEATQDPRAVPALEKNLHCIDDHIDTAPLFNWGQFRWFEALIAIFWVYERSGETWLLNLATKLSAQGFDWAKFFTAPTGWPAASPTPKGRWSYMRHVVNNAMAVKSQALWWRMSGDDRDREIVYTMLEKLHKHHGMVTGVFTGDECLAGLSPTQGTELCAVVEYAFSLETLLSIMGDPAFGDHAERIIFNALPATFSPDMWAHQYDQQVNQIECSVQENRAWNTNGPESNIFGVEPNYGCCTANLSQGWPKFAAHLWMQPNEGGLAATLYAPNTAHTTIDNVAVTAELITEYPFDEHLTFYITTASPVNFTLHLRIPEWAQHATVSVNDASVVYPVPGSFHTITRTWQDKTTVILMLPAQPKIIKRAHAVTLVKEPLVYALSIGEKWQRIHSDAPYRDLPHADWEVYPTTPWNYALCIEEENLEDAFKFHKHELKDNPFSPQGAPVSVSCMG
ncbi:MAG: hypothetical protein E4H27_00585, partial [Anaerolineales bacterium]